MPVQATRVKNPFCAKRQRARSERAAAEIAVVDVAGLNVGRLWSDGGDSERRSRNCALQIVAINRQVCETLALESRYDVKRQHHTIGLRLLAA